MYKNLQAIILAAGKASRFNTNKTKLVEKICGQEMILYLTKVLDNLNVETTLVVGYQRENIESIIRQAHGDKFHFVHQQEQLGTGHALLCTQNFWDKEHILILNGDVPLIDSNIINQLYQKHLQNNAAISFITTDVFDASATSYGRVVFEGDLVKIIEAKDDNEERKDHCCVNAGIYLINKEFLKDNIAKVKKSNTTGEFYITELINLASTQGNKVETMQVNIDLVRGINTLQELWTVEQIKRAEIIKNWMHKGIRFTTAQNNHIDLNVEIGSGTCVGSGTQILGFSKIGQNCTIEAFSILDNAIVEDGAIIKSHSIVKEAIIKKESVVGPFAYVHANAEISEKSKTGNFVEVSRRYINSSNGKIDSTIEYSFVGAKVYKDNQSFDM